jgi:phosphoribosyl-dephospho-CoA transferase
LLLPLPRRRNVATLTAGLAAIEAVAPMGVDGEVVREDGAGVNWRELDSDASEVLVKTTRGVALLQANHFLSGGGHS